VTVGRSLTVALTALNVGQETITVGGALHTYFKIADIDKVAIEGLNNSTYIDSLDNRALRQQKGEVRFRGEVDRIYLNPPGELSIRDDRWKRRITLNSAGSRTDGRA
jgi:glucose-6-phosphate 1-epimerase